ncbi:hypothetical protein BLOT_007014 [Blomia tropicalis]|nr:hypothetical protein BLOT_007014 [Blomia tropicalis]
MITIYLLVLFSFGIASASIAPKLVEVKPKIFQDLETKFNILCSIQKGTKPLQFEWRKNTKVLKGSNANIRIQDFEDNSLLIINQLSSNDSARYTCTVRNQFGSDSQSTELNLISIHHLTKNIFINNNWSPKTKCELCSHSKTKMVRFSIAFKSRINNNFNTSSN